MEDYSKIQHKQFHEMEKINLDRIKKLVRGRIDKLKNETPLPRYLLRALESGEEYRVEACINKAIKEGWTADDLSTAIDQHRFTDT